MYTWIQTSIWNKNEPLIFIQTHVKINQNRFF